MANKQNRKLAAILFADIVDYTALMQKDEATTFPSANFKWKQKTIALQNEYMVESNLLRILPSKLKSPEPQSYHALP